ncbi:hypothetical protein ACP70R_009172 [Stipagrostis hirtigluma subsp. patula]
MAKQLLLPTVVLMACILLVVSSTPTVSAANLTAGSAATVYDVLQQNNLPRGLLPLGVQSYALHAGGALQVTLPGECNFGVTIAGKQYKFRYQRSVSGVIQPGSISRVSGVSIQVAFAWLGFNKVDLVGDQLKIQLETSTQSFPVKAFSQSPQCN